MAWWQGLAAKIVGRRDKAFAEVVEPDAVDQHTRGQRVALVRDGLRQFEPAAAVFECRAIRSGKHFQKPGRAGGLAGHAKPRRTFPSPESLARSDRSWRTKCRRSPRPQPSNAAWRL